MTPDAVTRFPLESRTPWPWVSTRYELTADAIAKLFAYVQVTYVWKVIYSAVECIHLPCKSEMKVNNNVETRQN